MRTLFVVIALALAGVFAGAAQAEDAPTPSPSEIDLVEEYATPASLGLTDLDAFGVHDDDCDRFCMAPPVDSDTGAGFGTSPRGCKIGTAAVRKRLGVSALGFYRVDQRVGWCFARGLVTKVVSFNHFPTSGGLCGPAGGTWGWQAGGGVGQGSVDFHAAGNFSCSGFGWTVHENLWLTVRYTGKGEVLFAGSSK